MALNNSILSRFFDFDSNENEDESESNIIENKSKPEKNNTAASAVLDSSYLKLEPDHPIYALWHMRMETVGRLPAPALQLNAPPGQPEILSPEEKKRELSRLLFTVSSTANKRLLRAAPAKGIDIPPPDMDAEVIVFTTSDNLASWFLLYPPVGAGAEADRDMLENALISAGVNTGVDQTLCDSLLEDSNRYFHMHLAARGEAPVHGENGRIIDLFSRSVKQAPKMNESGKIDYTELNLIQNVKQGETICRIIPPTTGTPGISVTGQSIPCKPGKPASIPIGRNTELSEDGTCLIASITGRVDFSGRSFQVKPILEIRGNVDYSTGNINFLGDVSIAGDICTGFSVKALGNITVNGVVEACKVEAGGNVTIQKGVKGDNQATIQTHRNLYAKYLENCSICVREDLQSDCIINCNIYCDGSVHVNSGRGIIIGGKIRASNSVYAKTIGTKAEGNTTIALGGLPSAEFEYGCLEQELSELTSILEILERQPDSPAKLKGLPTVRMKITVTLNKLKQYKETLEELNIQKYVQKHTEQRLKCDIAYPGTELSIGLANLSIKKEARYCTAALIDGEIRMI